MSTTRYTLYGDPKSPADLKNIVLLYVSTAKYSGDWHSTPHTHSCAELFYVVSGQGRFKVGELTLPVSSADLVVINANVEHTELSYNRSPLEYIVLGVGGLEVSPGEDQDNRYYFTNLQDGHGSVLHDLREIVRELEERQPGCEVICQNLLQDLLIRIARGTGLSISPTAGRQPSKECALVRRYIDAHFKESISLDQLSQLAHVNKYYMVHTFSREYGISPINYLISRRISESKYLLAGTDHSLSQISHMLGFSSPSYFSQSFRRLEGMSPMEYRKSAQSRPGAP